jgi:hypothetical protein
VAKGSDNPFPSVLLVEQGSTPASPASGNQRLYIDSTSHLLKVVNSSGSVSGIGGSGGPQGELAHANVTTNQTTTSTSAVDLPGATVTLTATSRAHVVSFFAGSAAHSVSNGVAAFTIFDVTAGVQIQSAFSIGNPSAGGFGPPVVMSLRVQPGAGTRTYKVQFFVITAGTLTCYGSSTSPDQLLVVEV